HPGNFFVQPDGRLGVIDFGMVGRINEAMQHRLLRAGRAALQQDPEGLAEELYELGVAGPRADRGAFLRDLDHLVSNYGTHSLRDMTATAVTHELNEIAFRHKLQMPGHLAL